VTQRIRTLVLDFDGVILESNGLKTEGFAAVFARFPEHAGAMMAYHDAHVSESRFVKFRHLATELLGRGADDPVVQELGAAFSQQMRARLATCPMVPGARAFLDRIRGRLPVYLASMTPQDELDDVLRTRGLADEFTRVYGCPPWTKPRALDDAIRVNGREGLLFIGDSAGDQRAAREAGVEFLARDSGLAFDEPRPAAHPDMSSLLAALDSRLP
jgi:phosphoglycolate phosphatase-like HAD superfamily hydrolase